MAETAPSRPIDPRSDRRTAAPDAPARWVGGLTMPTAEVEAWRIACTEATAADGTVDEDRRFTVYKSEYERRIAERRRKLTSDPRAVFRAMDGWARVETADAWQEMV